MKPRLCSALLCATAFCTAAALPLAAQTPAPAKAPAQKLGSTVIDWDKLAVTKTRNGERRSVFDAPTATLANLESHITTLNGGEISHPPHRHADEELIVVKEGTIEVTINGETKRVGAGSIFFFAANDLHGLKNAGTTPATYFVFRFVTEATPKPPAK